MIVYGGFAVKLRLEEEAKKDPQTAISVSGFLKGLNNVLKNNQGMLDGFSRLKLLEKKRQFEAEFKAFLAQNPELQKRYGSVLDEIGALYEELRRYAPKRNWLGALRFVRLPNTVYMAYRYALEKEKPESEREPGFSEKRIQELLKSLEYRNRQYVRTVDIAMMKAMLKKLVALPADQQPEFLKQITAGKDDPEQAIDQYVEQLFAGSKFQDLMDAAELFQKSRSELERLNDPLIVFAKTYYHEIQPLEEKSNAFGGAISKLRSQYMKALFAWKGNRLYPDANRTIRFTYGDVRGYSPRDAVIYLPKTRLKGVLEKHTGQEPFDAPEKLLTLFTNRDFGPYIDPELGDVPVNFLHTTDITGGNSGSPVLNGRGELIGLAFDGNYEAMTSDYQFSNEITRTISVDARYILFILDKFSGATNILNELEIVGLPNSP
ncbi:MAG: S46 family peptidase [Calditrichaeota bacterium]|nr:S46 family peptidase [Calditrichota bacterium]